MDITEHIINHFDFLCNEGFKCSIISNNLEECVTYEGHGCEIVITYDLREHIIDFVRVLGRKINSFAPFSVRRKFEFHGNIYIHRISD